MITYEEVMDTLKDLGSDQTKDTHIRHGATEPIFGVKIGDMKKYLVKKVKKDQNLVLKLYDSQNSDAMYLAGLSIDPKKMTKEQLQNWVEKANWYLISEYTVAQVAAESNVALELAREWMTSDDEMIATAGWSTYSNYLSIAENESINKSEVESLLDKVEATIHDERNRVRYVMNGFVIAVGAYYPPLIEKATNVAKVIGKVHVDMGNTACKVPLATSYIKKVEDKELIGKKRKTCIC